MNAGNPPSSAHPRGSRAHAGKNDRQGGEGADGPQRAMNLFDTASSSPTVPRNATTLGALGRPADIAAETRLSALGCPLPAACCHAASPAAKGSVHRGRGDLVNPAPDWHGMRGGGRAHGQKDLMATLWRTLVAT